MLQVHSLFKSYESRPVLINFNLSLNPHQILFLTGPSGCGKSTALRAIANLEPYESGEILLNGDSIHKLGSSKWRRDVMYVSQARIQQNCTPMELFVRALNFASRKDLNIDVPSRVEEYITLCAQTGLERELVTEQKWTDLSGGQAQRAAVVMCVALKPKVLLLDEPSSSCDHQSALMLESVIIKSGIASVWVSHDLGQPSRVGGTTQQIREASVSV